MIMAWFWTGILVISMICAIFQGRVEELASAIPQGAQAGVTLAISMAGSICLWSGVGRLMEHVGITHIISKILSPLLKRIFPMASKDAVASQYLSANICANVLGLGNAATPMGIQAAKRLKDKKNPTCATDELCRLVVLNTASIQLIPATVAAVRGGLGANAPFDIMPAVWITSVCSTFFGLLAAWLLGVICRHD